MTSSLDLNMVTLEGKGMGSENCEKKVVTHSWRSSKSLNRLCTCILREIMRTETEKSRKKHHGQGGKKKAVLVVRYVGPS